MSPSANRTAIVLTCLTTLTAACSDPSHVEPGVSRALAEHRAMTVSELSYTLAFDVPAERDGDIAAEIAIEFELRDLSTPLQLDFRESPDRLLRLSVNGSDAAWEFTNEHIVFAPEALQPGPNRIVVGFLAGPTSLNRNPDYLYSLFVPDRARTAFPVFDQPDLKGTYELTLTVPADWKALSNAPVASIETLEDGVTYRFVRSQPISSYLFSFVAGRFEAVTRQRNGRTMTMLHRETDTAKVERNIEAIFDLHAAALEWLEDYTGIPYPWQKLDFALIPAFQYGGMEHVGAIQYRASRLLLDESPTETELLQRASVIAHETAHMWFGDLVTMRWFDDVWTKEVFANFMAAKIVGPSFPNVNHDLNFLADHYPSAYAVDRSGGANPIRQPLANLNEAGQLYGPIIYDKAPIMMRQLELLVGTDAFREGMREYLNRFSYGNASWPELIAILDAKTDIDLNAWSDVWVNTPGRPEFRITATGDTGASTGDTATSANVTGPSAQTLIQRDTAGLGRTWPQRFTIRGADTIEVTSANAPVPLDDLQAARAGPVIFNADGLGYGLFPTALDTLQHFDQLGDVEKGSELINIYENVLAGSITDTSDYLLKLIDIVGTERNQIILGLTLGQLSRTWISLLAADQRPVLRPILEQALWQSMLGQTDAGSKRMVFEAFADLGESADAVHRVYEVWSGTLSIDGLILSEDDYTSLAETLAIRLPDQADEIASAQRLRIGNPDDRRRFEFIAPALSASVEVRDRFFASLADEQNRRTESWVVDALELLHHPVRTSDSERYILPSLELLAEIQATGDIFFPSNWLAATLRNHTSTSAATTVREFLAERPEYNEQLRMKILQAADLLFRAEALRSGR